MAATSHGKNQAPATATAAGPATTAAGSVIFCSRETLLTKIVFGNRLSEVHSLKRKMFDNHISFKLKEEAIYFFIFRLFNTQAGNGPFKKRGGNLIKNFSVERLLYSDTMHPDWLKLIT